jgi:carbonic anhydrase/acetyltransferase-like protein (isoleucine patch superfamily)
MIQTYKGTAPTVHPTAFVAESALVIGDVVVGEKANIWFHSVVRGDTNYIRIGAECNIQDACVLHVVRDLHPLILEDGVVLGHRVVVHGCRIGRGSLIGMGAIVLNGAEIGDESIVGAGSVVSPGTVIPPRSLAIGIPARVVRAVTDDDVRMIRGTVEEYLELMQSYTTTGA